MGDEERDDLVQDEDEQEQAAASAEGAGKGALLGSRIVKILLYVAGSAVMLVLVVGISFLVARHVQESGYEKRQDIVAAPPPAPLAGFELPDISKTTADAEPHFVKMKMSLAYEASPELAAELTQRKDQILHIVNILLQGKRYEELDSVSDVVALAEEIKAHVNVILISGKIKEVYFKEFLVN